MKYPVVLHTDDGESYGVTVPDIPGCFSAGDSIEHALNSVEEAIHAHLELLAEDGERPHAPSTIGSLRDNPDYNDGIWGFVDIDVTAYMGKTEKVTITLPSSLVQSIDNFVKNPNNSKKPGAKNRSQFLAESAVFRLSSS